jgi:hypothetical protein
LKFKPEGLPNALKFITFRELFWSRCQNGKTVFGLRRRERIEGRAVPKIVGNHRKNDSNAHALRVLPFSSTNDRKGGPNRRIWSSLELLGAFILTSFPRPFSGPGPMICPGRIGHLVLRQKLPSRHPKSSNRTWNLGLQATLSRSTYLDPFKLGTFDKSFLFNPFTSLAQLRYVNFFFALYDD